MGVQHRGAPGAGHGEDGDDGGVGFTNHGTVTLLFQGTRVSALSVFKTAGFLFRVSARPRYVRFRASVFQSQRHAVSLAGALGRLIRRVALCPRVSYRVVPSVLRIDETRALHGFNAWLTRA